MKNILSPVFIQAMQTMKLQKRKKPVFREDKIPRQGIFPLIKNRFFPNIKYQIFGITKKIFMSDPRVFISFDFDNNKNEKDLFAGQSRNSRTPFNIEDWSSKTHLPQKEWEDLIKAKINKCNMLIVLVGKKTYTASGVEKEIAFANTHNVPVFGVYVDDAGISTSLPSGLARYRVVSWGWDKIADWIDLCMKEGKNK